MEVDVPGIDVNIMKAIDTCHDFYGGKRGKDNINVDYRLNVALKALIKQEAPELLSAHKMKPPKDSRLEPAFSEYLETKYPGVFVPIDQEYSIIDGDDDKNKNNLENYLGFKSVRLIFKDIDDLTNDLSYVGEFIRRFMFAEAAESNPELPIGFIIDANAGKLTKCFAKDKHVNTYVNALVIADSAGTGEKEKNSSNFYNRCNSYIFPDNIPDNIPPVNGLATYSLKGSLLFSKEFISEIYYQELSPDSFKTNLKSFKLVVKYEKNDGSFAETEAIFAPGNSQGATINTLAKLISIINAENTDNNKIKNEICDIDYSTTELDIRPIINSMIDNNVSKDNITKFLFDLKRTGDYEQVNSAKIMSSERDIQVGGADDVKCIQPAYLILSTGDQLCSMYARHENVPCVYNHSHSMDLHKPYKDTSTMNEEKYTKLCEEKVKYYNNFKNFLNVVQPAEIISLIEKFKTTVPTKKIPSDYPEIDIFWDLMNIALAKLLTENVITLLEDIISKLDEIIETYNKKDINNYLDNNLNKALKEKEKKLTIVLGIIYKFIEKNANNNVKQSSVHVNFETWILVEQTDLNNLNENNIFNYNFEPYFRLVKLYNELKTSINYNMDGTKDKDGKYKDGKITSLINKIADSQKKIDKLVKEQNDPKLTDNIRGKGKKQLEINSETTNLIGLQKGLLPSGAIGKYKNDLLSKISIIDDEIMQIDDLIHKDYKPFMLNNIDNNMLGKTIVEKYGEYIADFFTGPTSMELSGGENTPMINSPQVMTPYFVRNERDKEILSQEINNLLYMFSERIKSVIDALKSDSKLTPTYGEDYKEFIDELYRISKIEKLAPSCGSIYFTTEIAGKKQVKYDYDLFMFETRKDFNIELSKIMNPLENSETFYMIVKEILNKNNSVWVDLIDDKKDLLSLEEESDDSDDTVMSDEFQAGGAPDRIPLQSTLARQEGRVEERGVENLKRNKTKRQSIMERNRSSELFIFLEQYSTYTEIPKDEELIRREKEKKLIEVSNTNNLLKSLGSLFKVARAAALFKKKGRERRERERKTQVAEDVKTKSRISEFRAKTSSQTSAKNRLDNSLFEREQKRKAQIATLRKKLQTLVEESEEESEELSQKPSYRTKKSKLLSSQGTLGQRVRTFERGDASDASDESDTEGTIIRKRKSTAYPPRTTRVGGTRKYIKRKYKKTHRQRKNKKHSTNKIKRVRKNKYTRKNRH